MILPAILEDETLSSLLARMGRINGLSDLSEISTWCFGDGRASSFINSSVNVPLFCTRTKGAYGDASAIVETLTRLPRHMKLGGGSGSSIADVELGIVSPSLSSLTFDGSSVLAFCPECAESDLLRFGMTYWRGLHQMSIVHFCPKHLVELTRVSVSREKLHTSFPLPGDADLHVESYALWPANGREFWLGVLAVVCEVLDEESDNESRVITQTLADEAERRGVLTPSGLLRRSAVINDLFAVLGVNQSDISSRYQKPLDRLLRSLLNPSKGSVLGRAVFIHWFFGSWNAFKEQCQWNAIFEKAIPAHVARRESLAEHQRLRNRHRSVCMAFKAENPESTRGDFLVADYKSFRWLLHNDRQWLEHELPCSSKRRIQLSLF